VLSEYFFELPDLVQAEYPAVYDLLAAFYRQDPAARLRYRLAP
jgi:Mlc titration factor MtfA (ptsG expression regulator)